MLYYKKWRKRNGAPCLPVGSPNTTASASPHCFSSLYHSNCNKKKTCTVSSCLIDFKAPSQPQTPDSVECHSSRLLSFSLVIAPQQPTSCKTTTIVDHLQLFAIS
eukprot:1586820-Rhodomonas_salina.1